MAKTIKIILGSFFILVGILPLGAKAATLSFSPTVGTHEVGSTFAVAVYVSSPDQAMNAASGVVSFPADKLEVVSLAKAGSIASLWVQEPTFSNQAGTVNFEGIVLNPGFTGSNGRIIAVTFRVKAAGEALVSFSSGSVLANDGSGTNIVNGLGTADFSLGGGAQIIEEPVPTTDSAGVPKAPLVSSPTHPSPNKWYADNNPKFTWFLAPDIGSVRLSADKLAHTIPTVSYAPPLSAKNLSKLSDGTWYLHVRLNNDAGWGETGHFRFQIDTQKPDHFDIREIERKDQTEPQAKFTFDASDKTSGIDHFTVQLDNGQEQTWVDDGSATFQTPILGPGKHTLIAKAFDKAGNSLANSVDFSIKSINPPIITDYPRELASSDILIIKGTTYPKAQVAIWLEAENHPAEKQIAKSDADGNFTFIAEKKLKDGLYHMWAEAIDERGATSEPTEKYSIAVTPATWLAWGAFTINFLALAVPIVAILILILIMIWYGWHRFATFRNRLNKEVREAEQALHKSFNLLKEDVKVSLKMLEKKTRKDSLTDSERKIINQLKNDLKEAEDFVTKEIRDISNI